MVLLDWVVRVIYLPISVLGALAVISVFRKTGCHRTDSRQGKSMCEHALGDGP